MFNNDDDDFNFPSSGSTSLSSLFGVDQIIQQSGNEALTYTAPKQPKKSKESKAQIAPGAPSVLNAVAVHAYKFTDGKYAKQGKLGAAIVGNHSTREYNLLLYVSKQQQVTSAKITSNFLFTIQVNNYASFYDDQRQNWSIMFESEQNAVDFSKQIGIAKANSCKPLLDKLIVQDLLVGEGNPVESGDSLEVRFTGWIFTDHVLGQEFESNVGADKFFRFKLNSSKSKILKGWEEGLIGLKKNGKRLLIIPSSLGYGNQGLPGKVPPNATIVHEIEITKLKQVKEKDSPRASSPITIPTQAQAEVDLSDSGEDTIKARSHSLTQQLSQNTTSDKAKIISRMARMGQQMLPLQGAVPSQEDSDIENEQPFVSETEENLDKSLSEPISSVNRPTPKPRPSITAHTAKPEVISAPPVNQPIAVYQPVNLGQHMGMQQPFMQYGYPQMPPQQYNMYPQQPFMQQPPVSAPAAVTNSDAHLPLLMAETRQHNTEMRLAISKASDKIDQIVMKFDQLHYNPSAISPQMSIPTMESTVLLQNLQRIISENESLKKDVFEKNNRIDTQNLKINELLQRNQLYIEQSNSFLEQRHDSYKSSTVNSQSKVLLLEQEKVQLTAELSEATSKLSAYQLDLTSQQRKESELQNQLTRNNNLIQKYQDETKFLKEQSATQEKGLDELTQQLKDERLQNKQMQSKLTNLEEEVADLKNIKETLERNLSERKKKMATDQKQSQEELEDLRTSHEAELELLRSKLRKSKTTTDSTSQLNNIEEELNAEWQEKCNRLLAAVTEKNNIIIEELNEEKQSLSSRVQELEQKLNSAKNSHGVTDYKITELENQIESLKGWQLKHSVLQASIETLKEHHNSQVMDLKQQLETAYQQNPTEVLNPMELFAEVKRIMNSVYHQLQSRFETEETYSGNDIKQIILNTIRTVTLELMQQQQQKAKEEPVEAESPSTDEAKETIEENSQISASLENKIEELVEEKHEEKENAVSELKEIEEKVTEVKKSIAVPKVSPPEEDEDDETGKPRPPPPPLFEDDDDDDSDWVK